MSMLADAARGVPKIIGPAIHRLGGLTLSELHYNTGLPGCFIEDLLMNDFRPDTSWSKDLPAYQAHRQALNAYELVTNDERFTPENSRPHVCYHTTVILYQRRAWSIGQVVELARYDLTPRSWPCISFVERLGELWEVTGGRVFHRGGAWRWEHFCCRNTELARHFRGEHGTDCVPCRQIAFIKEYGHGNYGTCADCGNVFYLVPDAKLGPIIPRHACIKGIVRPGWWPAKILEPAEAKGQVTEL